MLPSSARFADSLRVVGLDVGSTTSSILMSSARLIRNCVTGRSELGHVEPVFLPEPVFTPFDADRLAIDRLAGHLDEWIAAADLDIACVAAGGALVTGLAARAANAAAVTTLVKDRFRNAVVARADDPCLESWLAFMGNTLGLSRAEPNRAFINLDIGGGTTNVAWGNSGEVRRCGCYFVGARHIQVGPGSYRLRSLSPFAQSLLQEFDVPAEVGAELNPASIDRVLNFYVGLLESAVTGQAVPESNRLAAEHTQVALAIPRRDERGAFGSDPVITLSGGVGELAYRHARGERLPTTTTFGDLGIDLAIRICRSPILGRNLTTHVPVGLGRATVQGLAIHSTEVSGATLYLPRPDILPLTDLPILGRFGPETSAADLASLLDLAARATTGGCLRVDIAGADLTTLKSLGTRLADLISARTFPAGQPLVLLTASNIGKTLGQYATRWGRIPVSLVVVDELPPRPAHFATIGKPCHNIVPVSFHGWESRFDQ